MNRAVSVMEVGPPGSPCRRRTQTAVVSCRSRAGVGSDHAKRPAVERVRCATGRRTCVNHCRRIVSLGDGIETGAGPKPRDNDAPLGVSSAGKLPACGPGGVRCEGGASPLQALAWNRRTCRRETAAPWRGLREGGPGPAETGTGRVPRGTGADRLVVARRVL